MQPQVNGQTRITKPGIGVQGERGSLASVGGDGRQRWTDKLPAVQAGGTVSTTTRAGVAWGHRGARVRCFLRLRLFVSRHAMAIQTIAGTHLWRDDGLGMVAR